MINRITNVTLHFIPEMTIDICKHLFFEKFHVYWMGYKICAKESISIQNKSRFNDIPITISLIWLISKVHDSPSIRSETDWMQAWWSNGCLDSLLSVMKMINVFSFVDHISYVYTVVRTEGGKAGSNDPRIRGQPNLED